MLVAMTGATGFIGSYTVRKLKAAGHEVRALVRRTSACGHIGEFVDQWITGEIADPQAQAGLVAGVDCVIHAAVDRVAVDTAPMPNLTRNVLPSLQLLEAARLAGVGQFIFLSSGAAYHDILQDRKLDEKHPTWPNTIYGAYKAAVEPFLKAYYFQFGMNTSAWRPVAVYGVDPVLARSRWLKLVETVRQGGTVATAEGGKIVHVEDVADALVYSVGDEKGAGEFYIVVDCHMYWQVAAEMAKELTGSKATIEPRKGTGPKNTFDTSAAGMLYARHGNQQSLHRGLDGVRQYVAELLNALKKA